MKSVLVPWLSAETIFIPAIRRVLNLGHDFWNCEIFRDCLKLPWMLDMSRNSIDGQLEIIACTGKKVLDKILDKNVKQT